MAYTPYFPSYGGYSQQGPYSPQNGLFNQQTQPMQIHPQTLPGPSAAPQSAQGLSPASRLVSSREEAVAAPADFSGALMMFPDITHNRIYTKCWNMQTGAADFIEFAPYVPEPVEAAPSVEYATAADMQELRDYLDELYDELRTIKEKRKVVKRVEPDDE